MLTAEAERPLLEKGWERRDGTFTWKDPYGTSITLSAEEDFVRIHVYQDDSHVLAYDIHVNPGQVVALTAALAEHTDEMADLRHGNFSRAVAQIAPDTVVKATDGLLVRPRLLNGDLTWDSVGPKGEDSE